MLPTVVFMHVNHNKHASMIGKFDQESILDHEDRFKLAKLPLSNVKVDQRELKFSDIDCQAQVSADSTDENDDDFQEILAEILAEEKAKKDAEEAESGGSSSNKKKGKKGKGKGNKKGGKGKKNFKSDEL